MVQPLWLAIVLGGKHAGIQEYKDDDEPEHGLEKKMIQKRLYEKRSYKERSYKKKIIHTKTGEDHTNINQNHFSLND